MRGGTHLSGLYGTKVVRLASQALGHFSLQHGPIRYCISAAQSDLVRRSQEIIETAVLSAAVDSMRSNILISG
jgi:hypothetical protein